MMHGVTYDREDTCPHCKRKRSLELYDKNNRPAYFALILDRKDLTKLNNRIFYYMKCKCCGAEFRIDWSNPNRIPVPLIGEKLNNFLEDYISSYEGIS